MNVGWEDLGLLVQSNDAYDQLLVGVIGIIIGTLCVFLYILAAIVRSMVKWRCPSCGHLNMQRVVIRREDFFQGLLPWQVLCDKDIRCKGCRHVQTISYVKDIRSWPARLAHRMRRRSQLKALRTISLPAR